VPGDIGLAHPRTDRTLLEQSRRRLLRAGLIILLAAVLGAAVVYLTPAEPERIQGHAYPIPAPDHRITVEVLNASGRAGLARGATRLLRRRGLDVVFFGNADAAADSTRILVRQGDPGAGRDVRDALGVGRVMILPDTLRRVDVSVILGRDFRIRGDLHP
jgi:hypothetical protein